LTRGILPRPRVIAQIFAPVLVWLAATLVLHVAGGLPLDLLTDDPTAALGGHPLTGAQSVIGAMLWWLTGGLCLFAWAVLRRTSASVPEAARFLLWFEVVTIALAIDDQFLVHEDLAARYLGLGQRHVITLHLLAVTILLVRFRATVRRSEWGLLAAALGFLGASVAVDYLVERVLALAPTVTTYLDVTFIEETFKLLGIVGWTAYLVRFAFAAVSAPAQTDPPASRDRADPAA
jgi:hypothetical protein